MEKRITIKKFLTAVALITSLGFSMYSEAQKLPLSEVCNASFSVSHLYAKSLPPQYAGSKFEALQTKGQGYLWDFGDGTQDTGKVVNHNFSGKGPYLVKLITYKKYAIAPNVDGLCRDTSSKWIDLNEPVCDAGFRPTIFATMDYPSSFSQLVGFRAVNETHKSYHWDFGDGTQDTGAVVHHVLPKTGKYYVKLRVKSYNDENPILTCEATSGGWFTYNGFALPDSSDFRCQAKLVYSQEKNEIKIHDEFDIKTLVYDGTNVKRTWNWGDGTSQEGSGAEAHIYQSPGTYTVTLIKAVYKDPCFPDNLNCKALPLLLCQEKYSVEVIVADVDEIKKCPTHIIQSQEGQTVTFRDNLVVDYFNNQYLESYEWNFGDGNTSTGRNVSHFYAKPGEYIATLKKTITHIPCPPNPNGITCLAIPYIVCSGLEEFKVTIGPSEKCKSNIEFIAKGLSVSFEETYSRPIVMPLNDTLPFYTINLRSIKYIWEFGDGKVDTVLQNPVTHNYTKPGAYKVKLTTISGNPYWKDAYSGKIYDSNYRGILPGGCYVIYEPCTSYAEVEIKVTAEEIKTCKAYFDWSLDGNQLKLKSNSTGDRLNYARLDYGDGNWIEVDGISIKSSHTYLKPGNYEICMRVATVSDDILQLSYIPWYCSDTYCQTITVGNTVSGLDDYMTLLHIDAFPNPANDKVTFTIINAKGALDLKIHDMSGYLVKEVKGLVQQKETVFVSELHDGVYVYSLSNANGVVKNGKLIVTR